MAKHRRDYNTQESMIDGIIEAIGEDTILELIIANMDDGEKIDLAIELRDSASIGGKDDIDQTLDDLLMCIEKFGEGNSSEDMRIRQMSCIWRIAGGQDDR